MAAELESGRIQSLILHQCQRGGALYRALAALICNPTSRIKFIDGGRPVGQRREKGGERPQSPFYFGCDAELFMESFKSIGVRMLRFVILVARMLYLDQWQGGHRS